MSDFSGWLSGGGGMSSMSIIGNNIGQGVDQTLAVQNYQQQLKAYSQNQENWNRMLKREDNAVQRRVRDLKKAGLSPTLAAGSAAQAGPMVTQQAPQLNLGSLRNHINSNTAGAADLYFQIKKSNADIAKTEADTEYVRAQTDLAKQANPLKIEGMTLSNERQRLAVELAQATMGENVNQEQLRTEGMRIANDFNRLAQDDRLRQLEANANEAETRAVIAKIDQILKENDVKIGVVDLARANLELALRNELGTYDMAIRNQELISKIAAAKIAGLDEELAEMDTEYFRRMGVGPQGARIFMQAIDATTDVLPKLGGWR